MFNRKICYLLKQVLSLFVVSGCSSKYLDIDNVESCPDHHGYDYFKGSELSFIVLWTCFGVIPFGKLKIVSLHKIYLENYILYKLVKWDSNPCFLSVCILSAYAAAKCRKWKHSNEVRKMQNKIAKRDSRNSASGMVNLKYHIQFIYQDLICLVRSVNVYLIYCSLGRSHNSADEYGF